MSERALEPRARPAYARPDRTERDAGAPLHVAIIMDGSGRWARSRGLPREAGHRAGSLAVRRIVEGARSRGIHTLTLFAFSSDNWRRPASEIESLMHLFVDYLGSEAERLRESGVRLSVIGRRDRLGRELLEAIDDAETVASAGEAMHLRLAIDYSGRGAILEAARLVERDVEGPDCVERAADPRPQAPRRRGVCEKVADAAGCRASPGPGAVEEAAGPRHPPSRETASDPGAFGDRFCRLLLGRDAAGRTVPDVDLLIRTGGEQRLSDCLLWECAYAELFFTKTGWPDFDAADLDAALREYHLRDRRFGRIPGPAVDWEALRRD